ncbi:PTS sugar transporter subunit IIB [Agromyces aurantiacus]|uniref:PTS sugar transporter subunit IIB n=1 Tax=Agromyces aurantiacus TaxID=165814 RepID=A0ABV9QZW0_9MICO|nr:PTS IIB subunit [Agromyces aurantiacus]MBM7505687.1 PTS system cellobiose-specific IIB component [Agromyces aurantiacus]
MRIVVVCGAGASSTFAALRIRRAADTRGLDVDVRAAGEQTLAEALAGADALLVGIHLAERLEDLEQAAAAASVPLAVLPGETHTLDGDAALDLAIAITGARS